MKGSSSHFRVSRSSWKQKFEDEGDGRIPFSGFSKPAAISATTDAKDLGT
jgi:hypothetical protein